MVLFFRYHDRHEDRITQGFAFSLDVAEHITGCEAPLTESMLVSVMVPDFILLTQTVVAEAFGDEETCKRLWATLSNSRKRIW